MDRVFAEPPKRSVKRSERSDAWLLTKLPRPDVITGQVPDVDICGRDGRIRTGGLLLPKQAR